MHGFHDPQVDAEHDRIITFFEALWECHGRGAEEPQAFADLSACLLLYLHRHCRREETLMRGHGYPDADLHARAHRLLQSEFQRVLMPRLARRTGFSGDLALVRELFLRHIVTWDDAFGAWLEGALHRRAS
jgi:hemerythrin-like metal-binding protein